MKFQRRLTAVTLVGTVALALCLSGCGERVAASVPVDTSASPAPAASDTTPVSDPNTPVAPVAPQTPAYTQPITGSLAVSGVTKKKTGGFLGIGRKLEVTGQVVNTSTVPLSGMLTVNFEKSSGIFTKTLKTEETKTQAIITIQPGQSVNFDITSDHSCDDADPTVQTNTPAAGGGYGATGAAYGAAGSAYGASGAAYGATTGATGGVAAQSYGGYGYPSNGYPTAGYPATGRGY